MYVCSHLYLYLYLLLWSLHILLGSTWVYSLHKYCHPVIKMIQSTFELFKKWENIEMHVCKQGLQEGSQQVERVGKLP